VLDERRIREAHARGDQGLENLKCFDQFLEGRFAEGLLPDVDSRTLAAAGKKATERSGMDQGAGVSQVGPEGWQHFDCATWLHRVPEMPMEQFKQEVEKELTERKRSRGRLSKLYHSKMPIIERAIETAALMLGSDRSRGYCLEMICADFLAGASLDHGDPDILVFSMTRFFQISGRATAGIS
jgi:hypothetical protein